MVRSRQSVRRGTPRWRPQDVMSLAITLISTALLVSVIADTRSELDALSVQASKGSSILQMRLDGQVPDLQSLTKLERKIDATKAEHARAETAVGEQKAYQQAAKAEMGERIKDLKNLGITADIIPDPGPEPDPWGPNVLRREWQEWKARKMAWDALGNVRKAEAGLAEATGWKAAVEHRIEEMLLLKNQIQIALANPSAMPAMIRDSWWTRVSLVGLHGFLAFGLLCIAVRSLFHSLLLRGLLGQRSFSAG